MIKLNKDFDTLDIILEVFELIKNQDEDCCVLICSDKTKRLLLQVSEDLDTQPPLWFENKFMGACLEIDNSIDYGILNNPFGLSKQIYD